MQKVEDSKQTCCKEKLHIDGQKPIGAHRVYSCLGEGDAAIPVFCSLKQGKKLEEEGDYE